MVLRTSLFGFDFDVFFIQKVDLHILFREYKINLIL